MDIPERGAMKRILITLFFFSFIACAGTQQVKKDNEFKIDDNSDTISETIAAGRKDGSIKADTFQPAVPEFVPVKELSSPLATKSVSVSARSTPLRDVLYTIAETANLNLVMENGVNPDLPITMTFKDVLIEDALNIIFNSADYFYTIKDNILIVKAMETRIFELGQPNMIQEYKINIGGDILSGVSSEGSDTTLSGDVSLSSESDQPAFEFWKAVESSLNSILKVKADSSGSELQADFTINRMTGTVMVTASKKGIEKVQEYILDLKEVLNRQVIIEARIVEVQLSEGLKYGINWTEVGKWFDGGTTTLGTNLFSTVVGITEPSFEFTHISENANLDIALRALEEQGIVETLSNPRINIMNGQTAVLSVGRNTTFISRVESTTETSGSTPVTTWTVDTNSILSGIMFGLVPYINSDGEITMTITPIISDLVSLDAEQVGSGGNSVEIKLPTVDLKEMSTTVKVLNGQLVIIGGLIDKEDNLSEDKVPILADIPFLGAAFKRVEQTKTNKELVIMLIPRLVS
jgi:MSHA type pilus biogenesis protein MshL